MADLEECELIVNLQAQHRGPNGLGCLKCSGTCLPEATAGSVVILALLPQAPMQTILSLIEAALKVFSAGGSSVVGLYSSYPKIMRWKGIHRDNRIRKNYYSAEQEALPIYGLISISCLRSSGCEVHVCISLSCF